MNEQNNTNVTNTQPQQPAQNIQPTPVVEQPVNATEVQAVTVTEQAPVAVQPTQDVAVQAAPAPVQQVVTEVAQPATPVVTQEVATQPVAQPAVQTQVVTEQPAPAPAPVQQNVAPAQAVAAQPVSTPEVQVTAVTEQAPVAVQPTQDVAVQAAPAPVQQVVTEVAQPATPVVTQEVATQPVVQPAVQTQVVTEQPAPAPAPVQQTVAPATQTDIVAQAPLNPLANEPVQTVVQEVAPATNGVFAPSAPLEPTQPTGGAIDSSNVGFVAISEPPKKKKNKPLIITIVLVIIAALAAVGYFFVYPFVVNKFFNDPKKVYETVIRTAFNELSTNVTELVHDKAKYDIDFSFDSNIPLLQPYGGYTYGVTLGADPAKELIETKFVAKNKNNQAISYESYLKDGKKYLKYHNKPDYIYAGEAKLEDFDKFYSFLSFGDILELSKNADSEDINYLINKLADLLVGSMDNSKLSKEEASLTVNGKTIKVINNKYQIDEAVAEAMIKYILNGISEDDKSIDILAQMLEMETSTLKQSLKSALEEDKEETEDTEEETTDKNTVYTISIYTTMGIKPAVVGYGLKNSSDESTIHYYKTEDYFEFKLYSVTKDVETNKKIENSFDVIGKTANGKTKVSVTLNDKEIMSLDVKDWTDNLKDLDYTVKIDEESAITGGLKYEKDLNDKRLKNSIEFSLEMGEQFVAVVVDFTEDWSCAIANIDTNNAVTLSDDQINEYHNSFLTDLYKTPVGELFKTVSGDVTPGIGEYYEEPSLNMEPLA